MYGYYIILTLTKLYLSLTYHVAGRNETSNALF